MSQTPCDPPRRGALLAAGLALGSALWLPGCAPAEPDAPLGPVEALMLQHGLLRRILAAYRQGALMLRVNPGAVDAGALNQAAVLFRAFGEDFHERDLEEAILFPAMARSDGPAATLVGVLQAQHARGREITDFIHAACAGGQVGAADAEPLARALESMAQMFEAHTAIEDTVLYPAWRRRLSKARFEDLGHRFDDLQTRRFKGGGLASAQLQIGRIEQRLNLNDLATYTAPPPAGGLGAAATTPVGAAGD